MTKTGAGEPPVAQLSTAATPAVAPDRARIAARAYELYQARGGADGRAIDDWLSAEREMSQSGSRES